MFTPLTLANLSELVGKTIEWRAAAYKGNSGYHGIEKIIDVDITCRRPIVATQSIDPKSDCLCFAFTDDHGLEIFSEGFKYLKADGTNNCLSYSDSDREVFFRIVEDKNQEIELTRVYHQKEGGRVCDFLTNLTIEEVTAQNEWLQEPDRKIISTKAEKVIINDNPKCRETFKNGILSPEYLAEKPDAYADNREWNEMYQKHTGNTLPKGGILR